MKRILTALLLCLLVQPAFAADKWLSIHSKNFLLVGNATEADIRKVGHFFEEFRGSFTNLFPKVQQSPSVPTTIFPYIDSSPRFGGAIDQVLARRRAHDACVAMRARRGFKARRHPGSG